MVYHGTKGMSFLEPKTWTVLSEMLKISKNLEALNPQ